MKLIRLHINAYGKLINYDYEFENVSTFCEENGFGKSTIVSFIKAMFYGLESVKDNNVQFLDRMHFYPFSGGNFGGNIEFSYNGHIFRIERTFDKKSSTKDTLKVYCDNNETAELGEVPGVSIFGINKSSFERLISIDSDKIAIETDSDINKKLNNYVENVGEEFDVLNTLKKIKDKKKEKTKLFNNTKISIKALKEEIKNLEDIKESLNLKYNDLSILERNKNEAIKAYDDANKEALLIDKWNNYDNINNDINIKKKDISNINNKYEKGLPEETKLEQIIEENVKIKGIEASLKNESISLEDKNSYDTLKNKYNDLPKKEELDKISNYINQYDNISKRIKDLKDTTKSDKEKELENHFYGHIPNDNELSLFEEEIMKIDTLENDLKNIPSTILETVSLNKSGKKINKGLVITLIIISIVLLSFGIGLLFVNLAVGIILIALGVISLLVLMFMYFNTSLKNIKEDSQPISKSNQEYELKDKELEKEKSNVLKHFANYRYNDNNPNILLYQLKNDLSEYKKILLENEKKDKEIISLNDELDGLKEKLDSFFNKYSKENISYKDAYKKIEEDLVRLNILSNVIDNYKNNQEDLLKEKEARIKIVDDFYEAFVIPKDISIDEIKQDIIDFKRLNKEYKDLVEKALKYKEDNNLKERPINNSYDMDLLRSNMDKQNILFTNLKREIEDLEDQVSLLDDKLSEFDRLTSLKEEIDVKILLYDNLILEIEKADQQLKDKYIAPIKDKFIEYANLLEESIGEKVSMDKNYKISFDREGALRRCEHLSSGNLSLCAFCFRLALIDNMFDEELPFLILDDPFVMLDSNHINKAKDLLQKLSCNKQIIYFCCHDSRKI